MRNRSTDLAGVFLFLAILGSACDWSMSRVDSGGDDGREDGTDTERDVEAEHGDVADEGGEAEGGDAEDEDGEAQEGDVPDEDGAGDGADACVPAGVEVCNGLDDDCDGQTDEDFDLRADDRNCGACGWACEAANGTARCTEEICAIAACDEGFVDLDGAAFDGCEYPCTATATVESSADGTCEDSADNDCDGRTDEEDGDCTACVAELCDSLDNDCDGLTDEDFDLQSDPIACGSCGRDCPARPHGVPVCVRGECFVSCEAGWIDLDREERNGCETTCTPSPALDETACDGIDADCDGLVDEDYLPSSCGSGECEASSVCWHGEVDCTPLAPGYAFDTVCDGLDQDCNGTADEDYVPSGFCTGECHDTATCVGGVEICGTPPASTDELCDGLDEDCDGGTDEDYVPVTCGEGDCTRTSTCIDGVANCFTGVSTPEVCNGSDDDCDGLIDDPPDTGELCPPPAHVSRTVCLSCGPGCGRCGIASDGCSSGFHDVNGAYTDGCECAEEATESASSRCPDLVRNLGDLRDTGAAAEVTGNCIPAGDIDWYRFRAVDMPDTSCDAFHVTIEFLVNPDSAYRFDIYRGSDTTACLGSPDPSGPESLACVGESRIYERFTDFRTGTGYAMAGQCPCVTTNTPNYNLCTDDTQYYWVKVYHAGTTSTCESYTIRMSNGEPAGG